MYVHQNMFRGIFIEVVYPLLLRRDMTRLQTPNNICARVSQDFCNTCS